MSDHIDEGFRSPENDPRVDITDVYAFHPPSGLLRDRTRVVLSMGVNPFLRQRTFKADARYEIAIDTNGDAVEDIVLRWTFGNPDFRGNQDFKLVKIVGQTSVELASGRTNDIVNAANNIKVLAGIRDDPFFIDLQQFLEGAGRLPQRRVDSVAGKDLTAMIIELPRSFFDASDISIWGRVLVPGLLGSFRQVDRAGQPDMSALFVPQSQRKNFNQTQPRNDKVLYTRFVRESLMHSGGYDRATADDIADSLLPDVLTFDLSRASEYPNGRNLEDDIVDYALKIARNDPDATDGVDANDVPFLNTFPYYAPAHGG